MSSGFKQLHLTFAGQIETVPTVADLPTVGIPEGGIRYTLDTDEVYVYNGTTWTAVNGGSAIFTSIVTDSLTVNDFAYINADVVEIGDNIIVLNSKVTGTPTEDAGIEIERGSFPNSQLLWDEEIDQWTASNGTITQAVETFSFNRTVGYDVTIPANHTRIHHDLEVGATNTLTLESSAEVVIV